MKTNMRLSAVVLCVAGATGCGAGGPDIGMTIRGLDSVPQATKVDIQLHPSDRACSLLHDTFALGARLAGATGTDVGIDTELLFGSIADGVYTISAIAHDETMFYADGCKASVELIAGEVAEVTINLTRFPNPVVEIR